MANEVVKYKNDLNLVRLDKWTSEQMNFFFAVCAKAKNHGTETMRFSFKELKSLSLYTNREFDRFYDIISDLEIKVMNLQFVKKVETSESLDQKSCHLFDTFHMHLDKKTRDGYVEVKVGSEFENILNRFDQLNFTQFELYEFVQLKSKYAKQLFRLVKQWRTIGYHEWKKEEFITLMAIPNTYGTDAIQRRVLKPAENEIKKFIPNFKIRPIKKKTKGSPIIGYRATWTPEKTNRWIEGKPQPNPNKASKEKNDHIKIREPEWYTHPSKENDKKVSSKTIEQIKKLQKEMSDDNKEEKKNENKSN